MIPSLPPLSQITYSSISLPRRHEDFFTRYRLLSLLNGCLERRLVLVISPAGYGKTSLLVDFAHQKDVSACWYTIDQYDQDLRRFLAHFIAAISLVFSDFGTRSNTALARLDGTDDQLEAVVNAIVNEIFECIHKDFWILLDDFHVLADRPAINAFLNRMVCRAPENCHLVIASRCQPALPDLELYKSRGQVGILGVGELAFIPEEVRALSQMRNIHLTIDQSVALVERTGGWITGLLLTSAMERTAKIITGSGISMNPSGLKSYWGLIFSEQPEVIRKFLLFSSLLGHFDASDCKEFLYSEFPPDTDWQSMLESVTRHNLFVTTGSDNESLTSLRYFPLFEDYLQARLERDYPGHTAIILLRKLGKYKQSADWHSAYRLCQQIDDISLTIEIIEQAGPALLANGMVDTLSEWLGELPADLLSTRPVLLSLKGAIALIGNDICNGLDLLNQAAAQQDSGDRRGLAHTLVYRSRAHYFLGEYVSALKDAEDSLALVGEEADLGEVKAQALRGRGMSLLRLNRTEESIQDLENSLAIFRALGDDSSSSHLHQELGSAYSVTGDLERAMSNYRKALEYLRSFADNYQMADLLDSMGVLHHHKGEYESSFLAFDEGLRHARQIGYTYREALILASLGDLLADLGADQIASEIFEEARCIAKRIKNRDLCFRLDHTLASLARRTGDLEESRRLWENAAKVALPDSMLEQSHLALESARLNLAENRISEAIPLLNIALAQFHSKKLATLEFQTYILLAAAFQAMDEEEVSRLHIKTAIDGDISDRLFQAGFSASREIIPVLERATQDMQTGIEAHRFLERLHRLNDRLPEIRRSLRRSARTIKLWHPRIAFRAFGEMHITFEGKELKMDDRKSKRQRDLLFYLLQHKKGTSKERLELVFGRNMDENGSWLRNALYKIRQFLASDIIIYQDGLYYFNPLLDYEYDVENFQYYLAKAKMNSEHPNSLILRQLVDIYRGDYAIGAEGNWVVPERERLDQGYQWAVSNLVVCYMDRGDGLEGMNVCLNAIELNPLCEEYYRLAMRVSAKMGNTGNVYRYYQLCCRALEKLEIAGPFDKPERARPSDQTYQLYKQLMK